MRVLINGFGRIGRSVLRAWLQAPPARWPDLEIVGINDIAAPEMCAYLFGYDSVFGPWQGDVRAQDGALIIDGRAIPLTCEADLGALDLGHVDIVMECTGRAERRDIAEAGLRAGASRVLISGPSAAADVTVVLGANEGDLADQKIVSNASCTTNALAPLVRLLDEAFGVVTGTMTTIHCYTGSQPRWMRRAARAGWMISPARGRRHCRWCRRRPRRSAWSIRCCRIWQAGLRAQRCGCPWPRSRLSILR